MVVHLSFQKQFLKKNPPQLIMVIYYYPKTKYKTRIPFNQMQNQNSLNSHHTHTHTISLSQFLQKPTFVINSKNSKLTYSNAPVEHLLRSPTRSFELATFTTTDPIQPHQKIYLSFESTLLFVKPHLLQPNEMQRKADVVPLTWRGSLPTQREREPKGASFGLKNRSVDPIQIEHEGAIVGLRGP
jgi:hypothetical protein